MRRNLAMLQRQQRLDQPRDAGGGFQVTQVRLYRADPKGTIGGPALAQHGRDCAGLDRIAQCGARSVCLDVADLRRFDVRASQGLADQRLLSQAVGRGEPAAGAILIDRGASNQAEDAVSAGQRIGQPLEHNDATTLASHETVG